MSKTKNWIMELEESMMVEEYSPLTDEEIKNIHLVLDADVLQFNMIPQDPEQCFEIEINHPLYQRMLIPFNYTEIGLLINKLNELKGLMGPIEDEE